MTVVDPRRTAVERLVFFALKDKPLSLIKKELDNILSSDLIGTMYENLNDALTPYVRFLKPNDFIDPIMQSHTSWFDLVDSNKGINVKDGYESSANSRIRDLTREAMDEINIFFTNNNRANNRDHW